MKIKTFDNKGLHITCSDGQVFSIQFGAGNYCENKNGSTTEQYENKPNTESSDCEMAAWDKGAKWNTQELIKECDGDDVVGYVPIKRALEIVLNYENDIGAKNV